MIPTVMPCISIQLLTSTEDENIQEFSNLLPEEDVSKTPEVRIPVITPGTYDVTTGKLTVTNVVDLSIVCPKGQVFVDNSGNKFVIKNGNSNLSGNKFINIGKNQSPDLGGNGFIESIIGVKRTDRRMIRLRETISLGCHAKDDVHLAKFIYILLTYILKSRQDSMEARGIALDKGNAQVFDRMDEFQGENVFSRYIEVTCITQFEWDQEEVNLVDCFESEIRGSAPDPDSETTIDLNTSD